MQRRTITAVENPQLVAEFAAALRDGQLAVLPTESGYGVAAATGHAAAADHLRALSGIGSDHPLVHHTADAQAAFALAGPLPERIRRFLTRIWPGPLQLLTHDPAGNLLGVRVPAHPFTGAVLRSLGGSALLAEVKAPSHDPDAVSAALADASQVALLADAGRPQLSEAAAIVQLRARSIEVVRPGLLTEQELLVGFATKILFVCTGNTCRSPLAEALARHLAAQQLEIEDAAVLRHGLCFASAGTGTMNGMPASSGSLNAAKDFGLDLSSHRSTQLTPELIADVDAIYCLSSSHRRAVLMMAPDAEAKTHLLHPQGGDVADPFGAPDPVYQATAREIEAHLRSLVPKLLSQD